MSLDVIKSLKSNLVDLTCVLFVIGKELELVLRNTDDQKVKNDLNQALSALNDANGNVIRLFHKINLNEAGICEEWYGDGCEIRKLQKEVDNLSSSIKILIEANGNFLNNINK